MDAPWLGSADHGTRRAGDMQDRDQRTGERARQTYTVLHPLHLVYFLYTKDTGPEARVRMPRNDRSQCLARMIIAMTSRLKQPIPSNSTYTIQGACHCQVLAIHQSMRGRTSWVHAKLKRWIRPQPTQINHRTATPKSFLDNSSVRVLQDTAWQSARYTKTFARSL